MTNDKSLVSCSVDEFLDMAIEKFASLSELLKDEEPGKKHLVYGLAGLAKLLGCSQSTAYRIKKSGMLNPAISQVGRLIVIDADLALDLCKLKLRRR